MALQVSLRLLSFVLLLFMRGYGSSARDMKASRELVEQKQENQAYITAYVGPPGSKGDESTSQYKAAYTSKEHSHPVEDVSYTSQYKAAYTFKDHKHPSEDGSYTSQYKAAYHPRKHIHPMHQQDNNVHSSTQNYLLGYENDKKDDPYASGYRAIYNPRSSTRNYLLGYENNKEDDSHASGYRAAYNPRSSTQNYLIGYINKRDDSYSRNAAYSTRKHIHQQDQKEMGKPYITAYGNSKSRSEKDSENSQPYSTAYGNSKSKSEKDSENSQKDSKEKNQPNYITVYGNSEENTQKVDSYAPGYKAAYNPRSSTQNYLIGYIDKKDDSYSRNAAYSHQQDQKEMGKPYITAYSNSKRKSEKDSENSQPYITAYGNSKREGEKDSENSQKDSKEKNQPNYITGYGNSDQDPDYITVYGRKRESSKVDHTEAFKTGFFALDDIYAGNTMTLQFPVQDFAHFLSRKEADSIPFSTSQLPSVLQLFSITEDSHEGKAMKDTLEQCELRTITGETKVCVTSLESMIETVQSILGTEDKYSILTTSYPSESSASLQKYTIVKVSEDIYAPKWVACHPMPYPYAVFFCHFINTGSKVFKVSLAGENGDKMEALGLCHMDTSDWSPDHILFQQLGFKPGDAPVCHFFPAKHLLWVPLPSKVTM